MEPRLPPPSPCILETRWNVRVFLRNRNSTHTHTHTRARARETHASGPFCMVDGCGCRLPDLCLLEFCGLFL